MDYEKMTQVVSPAPNFISLELRAVHVISSALDGSVPGTTAFERMGENTKTAVAVSIVEALSASGLLKA